MIKTEKRAWLLAAGNHGLSIEKYDSIVSLKSCWWQGLMEACQCLGEYRDFEDNIITEDEVEGVAEKAMLAEYDAWVLVLMNAHSEDEPLPGYWADVDEWLDEHSN